MAKRIGRRVDVLAKVMGKAKYTNDFKFEHMLYVKVVHSSYPYAKITSIELEQAEQYPGVIKVITADHIPGIIARYKEKPMLVSDIVRYAGEGIVLVVAETLEIAEEAAKLVKVNYEELPAVFTPEEALEKDAPLLYKEGNQLCNYKMGKGDVTIGFEEADYIFENEYSTHRVQHVAIEPEAAIAVPTFEGMTIYCPTNSPFNVRQTISETLGVDENKVRLILATVGGSFGGKNYDTAVMASRAAVAAKLTGRPCKIVNTREESIMEGTKRHPYKLKYKVGVTKEGKLTAMEINILGDAGAYTSKSHPVASRSCIEAAGSYIIPHVKSEVTLAYTNNVYSDALRGFGSPQVDFASEVVIDEVAKSINMDPIEFRKINMLKEESVSPVGQVMKDVSVEECLSKAKKEFNWEKRKLEIAEYNKNKQKTRKVRGLGIALLHRGEAFGAAGQGIDTSAVSILVHKDGSIVILSSMAEVGNGCHTMLINVVHETLGVKRERIITNPVDTNYVPNSGPTVATRGTIVPGNAMRKAAEQVKEKLAKIAAEKLEVSNEELIFKDEKVFSSSDPSKTISYFDLVKEVYVSGDNAYGHGWYIISGLKWDREKGNGEAYLSYVYGTCAAEVEVDLDTGFVSVEKFVAAHDVGHAFDKREVMGQINGGVSMGVGYAVMEEMGMKNGVIKNLNYDKYLIPTALDMPDTTPIVVEHPSKTGPYGARGLGEPVACSVAPAIINAIADATGIYVRDLPANLETMVAKLKEVEARS